MGKLPKVLQKILLDKQKKNTETMNMHQDTVPNKQE